MSLSIKILTLGSIQINTFNLENAPGIENKGTNQKYFVKTINFSSSTLAILFKKIVRLS
jgi:hypothetical protein